MNNKDFWESIHTIISEGFTPEGLQKLDHYAELFINGKLVYQRFSPFEQHGCSTGGATHVVASLLAGAESQSDRETAQGVSDFQRELQQGAQQASCIEQFVDCDIRINTPELRQGGQRILSTYVKFA